MGKSKSGTILFNNDSCKWWQIQSEFIMIFIFLYKFRSYFRIKNISGSIIFFIVAVKNLFCIFFSGYIHFPVIANNGCHIQQDKQVVVCFFPPSFKYYYTFIIMV